MKIVAEDRVIELGERCETIRTIREVMPGETVEALLTRIGMTGSASWHYNLREVSLKLILPGTTDG